MTRTSKQAERRNRCPKKRRPNLSKKTGPKKQETKIHENAINGDYAFIGKVKGKKDV